MNAIVTLLPTPQARNEKGYGPADMERHDPNLSALPLLLPTPSVADSTGGHERRGGERGEELLLKGIVRAVAEGALLPTPMAGDAKMARNSTAERRSEPPTGVHAGDTLGDISHAARWGEYDPAIRRWEALTRPAPEPTKPGSKGNPKLSDEFDEWLMGYPAGWITDVPGVTWNEALKACGNGVVPQQGAAAVRWLLTMAEG
jgi:DNA (cytosine-5)-methyltransferase 1